MNQKFFIVAVLTFLTATRASAQTEEAKKPGNGYFFVAPGVETCCRGQGIMQVGAGGEGIIHKGLGVNADFGYLFPMEAVGNGIFILSFGPTYQFTPTRKTVPFVTGGGSLAFRSEFTGAYHFGGGVIHWFRPRFGLRFEVRDYIPSRFSSDHLVVFRAGLALR